MTTDTTAKNNRYNNKLKTDTTVNPTKYTTANKTTDTTANKTTDTTSN